MSKAREFRSNCSAVESPKGANSPFSRPEWKLIPLLVYLYRPIRMSARADRGPPSPRPQHGTVPGVCERLHTLHVRPFTSPEGPVGLSLHLESGTEFPVGPERRTHVRAKCCRCEVVAGHVLRGGWSHTAHGTEGPRWGVWRFQPGPGVVVPGSKGAGAELGGSASTHVFRESRPRGGRGLLPTAVAVSPRRGAGARGPGW